MIDSIYSKSTYPFCETDKTKASMEVSTWSTTFAFVIVLFENISLLALKLSSSSSISIDETKELLLISDGGTLVRTRAAEVAMTGRNAQGVRLIRLSEEETLVGVVSIEAVEDEEELLEGEVDTTETDSEEAVSNNEDTSEE